MHWGPDCALDPTGKLVALPQTLQMDFGKGEDGWMGEQLKEKREEKGVGTERDLFSHI